jgi:hypothetical protein
MKLQKSVFTVGGFKSMVVKGKYSEPEKDMLEEWQARADKLEGWLEDTPSEQFAFPVFHRVASRDLIYHMACAADSGNPLWRDEQYAAKTRWGGLIAPPLFQHCISHRGGINCVPQVPPELGVLSPGFEGDSWDFFKHVYLNDRFKVKVARPLIEDITPDRNNAFRKFRIIQTLSYINQKDEVTAIVRERRLATILLPGKTRPEMKFTGEYIYSSGELKAIDAMAYSEQRRGAEPRYWDEVQAGDELPPIVKGPLTVWDQVVELQGFGLAIYPMKEARQQTPQRIIVDPLTGIPHESIEFLLSERVARLTGGYCITLCAITIEHFLARIITNWMGDDGFLKKLHMYMLSNTPLGDTVFGRGKVVRKYISPEGEHLVDLEVRMESNRGFISNTGAATVSLPVK